MKFLFKKIVTAILRAEARLVLSRFKPKIAVVVGTVGKTSTKDACFAVLSRKYFVRKSDKSMNSEIGIPLTILGLPTGWGNPYTWLVNIAKGLRAVFSRRPYPEWLVLEVGVDHPGDMKRAAAWIRPDAVILTRFGHVPVHVEFFPSPEALFAEKSHILSALKPDGVLVANADDERVMQKVKDRDGRTLVFGMEESADMHLSQFSFATTGKGRSRRTDGVTFEARHGDSGTAVHMTGTLGKGIMHSAGAALALGIAYGIHLGEGVRGIEQLSPPKGRMRVIPGVKQTTIIDDTYNSSPAALALALETLSAADAPGRKIAVLGDMLELGKYTKEEHRKAGTYAAAVCDVLYTVGIRARDIAEGALDAKMSENSIFQFDAAKEAGKFLEREIKEGDLILVKGSQGMRMERIVEEIMAEPEKKASLLVRQDPEWERR